MGAPDANLPKVLSALELLTEDELAHLNRVVVERLRLMRDIRDHGRMMEFHVGQRVQFMDTAGQTLHGVITRHNRKSVTVATEGGVQWRVAPGLIEPSPHQ